jgi:hypothetical protein
MDYILVINGNHTLSSFPPRVRVVQRENSGFDFDAYSHILLNVIDTSLYTHFIFLNGSVRGPFAYRREVMDRWQDELLGLLTEDIRLVGTTINGGFPEIPKMTVHVQSQVFAMDRECLELLIKKGIFSISSVVENSKHNLIIQKEIGMSTIVLNNGWNISCLAKKLRGYDYRTTSMIETFWRDPCYKDAYFGESLDAREILFIKTDPMRNLPIPTTALPP